jgi:acetyl-CoA carboxylase/biotin carboxylase 1
MQWHRSGLIASWEFLEGHIERKNGTEFQMSEKPVLENRSERKWGAMVIIKSLQFLPSTINAALRETPHNQRETVSNLEPASFGNMMHISLVGINNQMSLLQDR